jgi:hypothetical protein
MLADFRDSYPGEPFRRGVDEKFVTVPSASTSWS